MTDKLIQQSSRHSIYTQRFAGYLANLFDPYLERLQKELKVLMVDMPETTQNMRRINRMLNEYRKAALVIYDEYNVDILLDELRPFATSESLWQLDSLDSVIESDLIDLKAPAPVQVWAGVTSTPLVLPDANIVRMLDPFINGWEAGQITKVNDIIRTGFITGRTSQQIAQDIAGKNGYLDNQNRQSIKTMVRTATNHVSNLARQKTNEENSDIVKGYEIVATLDKRTTPICRGYDGAVVMNSGVIIHAGGRREKTSRKPQPPFHPGCRTTTVPVLDERYRIDDSSATRASVGVTGGKQVNAESTYYGWLKEQGAQGPKGRAFVMDVLGKERGRLFLDGGLSATKFKQLTTDELFQPIPLDELKKKQSLQLAFDAID